MAIRKAQIQGVFLKFVLSILILIILFLFIADSIGSIKDRGCEDEYLTFIDDFESMRKGLDFGEKINEDFAIPCSSDKVIFVDSTIEKPLVALEEYPFLNNELRAGTSNVFFIKEGSLKRAFSLDNIDVAFPYFRCYKPLEKKIVIGFDKGITSDLFAAKDERYDCMLGSPRSIELKARDVENLLEEIKELSKKYSALKEGDIVGSSCNATREFIEKDNSTKVKLSKKSGCDIILFDKIPKCAIDSLEYALDQGELILEDGFNFEILDDDPLMVWHFEESEDEILYTIKKLIDENCKDQFISSAFEFEGYDMRIENLLDEVGIEQGSYIYDSIMYIGSSNLKSCFNCMETFFDMVYRYKIYQDEGSLNVQEIEDMKFFLDNQIGRIGSTGQSDLQDNLDVVYQWLVNQ